MTSAPNFMMLAAVLSAVAGVALLYASWRNRGPGRPWRRTAGWLLIAVSIALWSRVAGPEFGPVIALLVMPLVAWCFVAANRHARNNPGRQQAPATMNLPRVRALARHVAIFVVAVPVAACTSTLIVLAGSGFLPWEEVDRLALAVLLMPVVWGLFAYWATADTRLARPAIGLAIGGSLGAALLFG